MELRHNPKPINVIEALLELAEGGKEEEEDEDVMLISKLSYVCQDDNTITLKPSQTYFTILFSSSSSLCSSSLRGSNLFP
ncbi:unnamed protein product [Cochlearia groenlandica]